MNYEEILKDNKRRANKCRREFYEAERKARSSIT